MKKTIMAISSIALAGVIVSGAFAANGAYEKKHAIGSDAALEIALKDAGINKADAAKTKSVLDRDGIHYVFDVEFDSKTNEYDYTINAKTGEIIKRDIERRDNVKKAPVKAESTTQQQITKKNNTDEKVKTPSKESKESKPAVTKAETKVTTTLAPKKTENISLDKAKSIALADAKLNAKSVKFTKARLDRDDGIQEYEIEFIYNGREYDYSINAKNGKIIDKDIEIDERTTKKQDVTNKTTAEKTTKTQKVNTTSSYISIERAKEIALSHAKLKASDVRFEKVVLDRDDGIYEYEIEFVKGSYEYEYSINAKTGAIIDFDIDRD